MVFDNLSPAVKAINGRDRQLTELFSRFRWHYQFEARFCNPGSPHEKGNVERKVGYVRRNVLSPPPVVRDLAEIDELLRKQAEKDLKRIHYRKGVPVEELWEEDRRALLPLPNQRFEVSRMASARVNRVSEIRFEGDTYRIPRAYPGQGVILRVFWDRLVVLDQGTGREVGRVPRQYAYDVREVDWKAELEIFVNKPRAVEQAVCLKAFPAVLREFILSAELEKRPRRIRALLALFDRGFDLSDMEEIVHLAGQYGRTDEESLKVVAGYRTGQNTSIEDPHTPEAARNWRPDMNLYALLTPGLSDDAE